MNGNNATNNNATHANPYCTNPNNSYSPQSIHAHQSNPHLNRRSSKLGNFAMQKRGSILMNANKTFAFGQTAAGS